MTGGSGFIGGVLVRRLVADGVQVTALARSEASADKVRELGAEPFVADLNGDLAGGVAGCDVAYHAAAFVEQWGPWEEFQRATVDGTHNVLAACGAAGVKRFVHVGTEAALVDGNALVNADESWPLRPDSRAYYPRSKARAEQAVVAANGDGGMETVVVRPRFVWGPGDTTLLPALVELIRVGQVRLGRRRRPPHLHGARGQRGRGPGAGGGEGPGGRGLLHHRRRADRLQGHDHGDGGHRGRGAGQAQRAGGSGEGRGRGWPRASGARCA